MSLSHTHVGAAPICSLYGIWGPSPTPRHFTNGLRGLDSNVWVWGRDAPFAISATVPSSFHNTNHSAFLTYEISARIQLRDSSNSHECMNSLIWHDSLKRSRPSRHQNRFQTTKKHHFSNHFLTPSIEYECSKTRSFGTPAPRARAEKNNHRPHSPMGCGDPYPTPKHTSSARLCETSIPNFGCGWGPRPTSASGSLLRYQTVPGTKPTKTAR